VIVGERVLLRPLDERDTDDVLRWRAEPAAIAQLFSEGPPTRAEHLAWLARMRAAGDRQEFVVVERGSSRAVGTIGLSHIDHRDRRAEYGILVGEPDARGKGLAAEASRLLLDHAFRTLALHRVYLHVFPDNEPALRLYRAVGFEPEGVLRDHLWKAGRARDVVSMAILSTDAAARALPACTVPGG